MSLANSPVKADGRNRGVARGGFGDEQIGAAVAMMMMTATGAITGIVLAIGGVFMMLGVRVLIIVDGIDREAGWDIMIVREHQSRRVLNLIGRFGRNCRRIEKHKRNAERGYQTIHGRSERVLHG